jgi:AcrR family transcriptional regulator
MDTARVLNDAARMSGYRVAGARRPAGRARRGATEARLLAAARRLFAERGFDGTSVTEIAREAGVTHALINAYFNGKAGLLYAIVMESNGEQIGRSETAEAAEGDTLDRLTRLVEIWAAGDLADPRLASVMLAYSWQWPPATEAQNRAQLDEAFAPAHRIVARGLADGELRPEIDVAELVEVIHAIYVASLRPAIFAGATVADCVGLARRRLDLVLSGARASVPRDG